MLRTAGEKKRRALLEAAQALRAAAPEILAANAVDLAAARESGMRDAMLDRLTLTEARIEAMAQGVEDVAAQRDPVGRVLSGETRPNGLKIEKVTVPMGVIGIIFEARPNVTSDAAALCLMAGSAVILRGARRRSTRTWRSRPFCRRRSSAQACRARPCSLCRTRAVSRAGR